jgi:hypothetical protein
VAVKSTESLTAASSFNPNPVLPLRLFAVRFIFRLPVAELKRRPLAALLTLHPQQTIPPASPTVRSQFKRMTCKPLSNIAVIQPCSFAAASLLIVWLDTHPVPGNKRA